MRSRSLTILLFALVAACSAPQTNPDTTTTTEGQTTDESSTQAPEVDAGEPVADAGAPEVDAGAPEPVEPPEPEPLFDHSGYDALLRAHVDQAAGRVDYAGIQAQQAELDAYVAALATAPVDQMSRDEQFALYANAYNAFTLALILEKYPKIKSIMDIDKPWKTVRWELAGKTVSLDQIEHEILRPEFKDPRVHFAVNCASIGCPPLRAEAFVAERLEEQLEDSTRTTLQNPRYAKVKSGRLYLTKILDWYGKDFVNTEFSGHEATVASYVAKYGTDEVRELVEKKKGKPRVRFMDYDWNLNDVK